MGIEHWELGEGGEGEGGSLRRKGGGNVRVVVADADTHFYKYLNRLARN